MVTDELWNDLFWVYFAVFAVAAYFGFRFQLRLRTSHPRAWEELGSPGFFANSFQGSVRYLNFMVRGRFEPLSDPTLTFYGRGARLGFFAILLFLFAMLGLMLIGMLQQGVLNQPVVVSGPPLNLTTAFLVVLAVAGLAVHSFFLRRLKNNHRDVWKNLGEPSLILNNTISNNWKMQKFILGGRFWNLRDIGLNISGTILWILSVVFLGTAFLALTGKLHP